MKLSEAIRLMNRKKFPKCAICRSEVFDLFRSGDKMVCCQCKYGASLWKKPASVPTQFSSRQQPIDLQWYDKHLK